MKLAEQDKVVKKNTLQVESTFKIDDSPIAYEVLFDRLYSNRIKAIVRELGANAYDAHLEAGIPWKPFEVNIPNSFNPIFSIKDFGKGIPPEQFNDVYTTVFKSTKSTSDEFVGCYGLGSKTPLSYSNQFTVENCYNGKKYLHTCFKNSKNKPCVELVHECDTEESGLKISIPVKREDFYNFHNEVHKVFAAFDVPPTLNSGAITKVSKEFIFEFDGVKVNKYSGSYNAIKMGNIIYESGGDFEDVNSPYQTKVLIEAPIGSVDVVPSREKVRMSDRTTAFIKKVKEEVQKNVDKELAALEDPNLSKFKNYKKKKEFIKGLSYSYGSPYRASEYFDIKDIAGDIKLKSIGWGSKAVRTYDSGASINLDNNMAFLYSEKELKNTHLLAYHKSLADGYSYYYILNDVSKEKLLKTLLNEEDIVDIKEAVKPPKREPQKRVNNCTVIDVHTGSPNRRGCVFDDSSEIIYVKEEDIRSYNSLVVKFRRLDNIFGIYALTDKQLERFKVKDLKGKHLQDVLNEYIIANKENYLSYLIYRESRYNSVSVLYETPEIIKTMGATKILRMIEAKDTFSKDTTYSIESDMSKLNQAFTVVSKKDVHAHHEDVEKLHAEAASIANEAKKESEEVYKKYPMLSMISNMTLTDERKKYVIDYINLVNKKDN